MPSTQGLGFSFFFASGLSSIIQNLASPCPRARTELNPSCFVAPGSHRVAIATQAT